MTGARHAGSHRASTAPPILRLVGGLLLVGAVAVLVGMSLRESPPLGDRETAAPQGSPVVPSAAPQLSTAPAVTPTATATATATSTTAPARPSATPTDQAAPRLALLVLNNSRIAGLAGRAAADFRAGGWPVRGTGNFRGRIAVTTVYYEPGQEASARRLMREFGKVRRMSPRFAGLPGSGLTVVVTRDYAAT